VKEKKMRQYYKVALLLVLVLSVLASGCAARNAQMTEEYALDQSKGVWESPREAAAPMATSAMVEAEMDSAGGTGSFGGAASTVANISDRMIIRTVSMSVVVLDTDTMLATIQQLVKANGGYVAASNRWLSGEQAYASVTLRVPAEKLEAVLGTLRDSAISVENESSSGDDVTEEYVDVSARLRNLEATEEELLQLLTEVRKNRGSAEDILAIHNRITQLRSEIESLKGRQQYLERSAALATIQIDIRPKQQPGSIVEPATWNPLVTLNRALRGLVNAGQGLLDMLIWIVILSPIFAVPIVVIWLFVRAIRRGRARRNARKAATSATPTDTANTAN
jgi:hypothetical protein